MPVIRNAFLTLGLLSFTAACANPVVAPPMTEQDYRKGCAAIEADIAETSRLKREARAEDKFQWKYVFILNGFVSWWQMDRAEKAAEARLNGLREAGQQQGCFGGQEKVLTPDTPPTVEPVTH